MREAQAIQRLMPDPLFAGSAHNTPIAHAIRDWNEEHGRELRPGESKLGSFILPPFQRPPVWTQQQQVRFLESIWLDLPVGVYIYNFSPTYRGSTDLWLIDGQQRVTALLAYVNDEFPVFGYRYSEITDVDRRGFQMKSFPSVQLKLDDEAVLRDIYDRLAYGGTPHEPPANPDNGSSQKDSDHD